MPSYHLLVWLQLCLTYSLATWIDDQLPQEGLTCENIDASVQDDLPNFDLLHRFQLDMDKEFPSMESIQGTDSAQFAYRINKDSQFALATSDIFPSGLPEQFSFSCTFRKSADNNRTWTLLRINDYNGEAQFGLTLQPQKQVMQFYTLQGDQNGDLVNSQLQTYNFDGVILDDGSWNKIHLSVYPTNVTLYVNCQKISHFSIKPRQIIDVTGDTWLAKYDDDFSTVPLDIQWMLMNCDASRPQRDKCDEISRSHVRQTYQTNSLMKSEHKYVTVVEEKCCQQSLSSDDIKELVLSVLKENLPSLISQFKGQPGKAGKPGKSVVGPPGAPGEKGEPGSTGERGFIGLPGTQGQAGLPGAKGIKGEIGEKGCKGDTGDKGIKGNVGRAGLRGPPGIGQAGSKGERGPSGNPGIAGVRGPQGPIGPPGVCEMCKTFNMDTLQLILSQNQRQTKGPSNTKSA